MKHNKENKHSCVCPAEDGEMLDDGWSDSDFDGSGEGSGSDSEGDSGDEEPQVEE